MNPQSTSRYAMPISVSETEPSQVQRSTASAENQDSVLVDALKAILSGWMQINPTPSGEDISNLIRSFGDHDPEVVSTLSGFVRDLVSSAIVGEGEVHSTLPEAEGAPILDLDGLDLDGGSYVPEDDIPGVPDVFGDVPDDDLHVDLAPYAESTGVDDFVPDEGLIATAAHLVAASKTANPAPNMDHRPDVESPVSELPLGLGDTPEKRDMAIDGDPRQGKDPEDVAMQHDGEPVPESQRERDGIPGVPHFE
jgi:hypothetical protein